MLFLHILLGILKLLGLLIALVLILLIALLMILLFVPLRYQLWLKKLPMEDKESAGTNPADEGKDFSDLIKGAPTLWKEQFLLEGGGRFSYFLHAVSAAIAWNNQEGLQIRLYLLGFLLPFFQKRKKTDIEEMERDVVRSETSGDSAENLILPEASTRSENVSEKSEKIQESENSIKKGNEIPEPGIVLKKQENVPEKPRETQGLENVPEEPRETQGLENVPEKPKKILKLEKAHEELEGASESKGITEGTEEASKSKRITAIVRRLAGKLAAIPQKVNKLLEKLRKLLEKPRQLLELARRLEIWEILGNLKKLLLGLWKHYGPRRICGFLNFGLGDPALTGEAIGLLYLLLPAKAETFSCSPDFYQAHLDVDLTCRGHIRLIHLVIAGIRVFADKKVRRLIGALRKRGK